MDKKITTYHKILRVSAVVFALLLVFQSGLVDDATTLISQNTHSYLANSIGVGASVQPTELNQYTAALTQKEKELNEREAALNEREISVGLNNGSVTETDTVTYVLASILFILLVLILLNYALDFLRAREQRELQTV